RANPTREKPGGSSPRLARSYTAGISFLRDRSPVTPKMTSPDGPAIRGRRRSLGSRRAFDHAAGAGAASPRPVVAPVSASVVSWAIPRQLPGREAARAPRRTGPAGSRAHRDVPTVPGPTGSAGYRVSRRAGSVTCVDERT